MPTFCRHGRFIERCSICSPEPVRATPTRATGAAGPRAPRTKSGATGERRPRSTGLKVRRETRAVDDGYRSSLAPGLRASADAERLADELAFACGRLAVLAEDPPGTYLTARDADDLEQGTWTALLTVYVGPLQDADDPFRAITPAITSWADGELPDLDGVPLGPRTSHDAARGTSTLLAYRQWAQRAGSQVVALQGDDAWTPARRFDRAFERLALPGLSRAARFDLLVVLGRLGLYELEADSLQLVGDDAATLAAKRVFGIGDRPNLERRSHALCDAAEIPLQALDLALANWSAAERMTVGVPADTVDEAAGERARDAFEL